MACKCSAAPLARTMATATWQRGCSSCGRASISMRSPGTMASVAGFTPAGSRYGRMPMPIRFDTGMPSARSWTGSRSDPSRHCRPAQTRSPAAATSRSPGPGPGARGPGNCGSPTACHRVDRAGLQRLLDRRRERPGIADARGAAEADDVEADGCQVVRQAGPFQVRGGCGRLTFINRHSTGGTNPVHLAVAPDGCHIVVSHHAAPA